jgi:GABA(A) receptor-associated protein
MSTFKERYSLEQRTIEANKIRAKYPDRIPVIVEVAKGSNINLDKNKFLVPQDITIGQFIFVIRKRIKLSPEMALFIFIDNTLPPTGALISSLYNEFKDPSGFLFTILNTESTFGLEM